ncbi:MAG: CoB--CoM heterodisulfide reductase subunit C [Methanomicrobiales archaeon]|nr:CoB--CoM heterodisulfide reductase subunit C [Methanomicrobiales archaeon]
MVKAKYTDPKMEEKLKDRYYYREYSNPDFPKKIHDLARTVNHMCFQCGTCTASCVSAPRSSYRIRVFMRRNVLGLEDEALTDPDLWLCTTCYSCTDRCPRDIAPTDTIMAMRNLAYQRGIVPVNFLKTVQAIYQSGHGVPNNDVNRAVRVRLGLAKDPPTTHSYPEFLPGIRQILDHYHVKEQADKIVAEAEKHG